MKLTRQFLPLLSFALVVNSCSLFIKEDQKDLFERNNITPAIIPNKLICGPSKHKRIVLSENKSANEQFDKFIYDLKKKKNLRFIDEVVLWSLMQMNLRPDLVGPNAKLQAFLEIQGQTYYFNSYSSSNDTSYLAGLNHLLKKYKSRFSLKSLSILLDKEFSGTYTVSHDFEDFLSKNKASISNNSTLSKVYMRGDETLKEQERIPRLSFQEIYSKKSKHTKSIIKNDLFKNSEKMLLDSDCNFDLNLYSDSVYVINPENIHTHMFGLKSKNSSFLAMSTQKIKLTDNFHNSFIFNGKSDIRSGAMCVFKHKRFKDQRLWLLSSESRDPAQHLYHLIQYGLENTSELNDLKSLLSFSRHLFLNNPVRLVIESKRSTQEQIQEILKLDIPVYNAKKLGILWGHFASKKEDSFIVDPRAEAHLLCK